MGWWWSGAVVLLAVSVIGGCTAGGSSARGTTAPQLPLGENAEIGEVRYVAFERVGLDRLPRGRMERAGEARIESQARRIPAYRLRDSPRAALRYTEEHPGGWLAWQPLAVLYARRELARRENVPPGQIQTVDVTEEMWTDSCLGAARPGELCAQAAVPGFRVTLRLGGRVQEYHTDREERVVSATP